MLDFKVEFVVYPVLSLYFGAWQHLGYANHIYFFGFKIMSCRLDQKVYVQQQRFPTGYPSGLYFLRGCMSYQWVLCDPWCVPLLLLHWNLWKNFHLAFLPSGLTGQKRVKYSVTHFPFSFHLHLTLTIFCPLSLFSSVFSSCCFSLYSISLSLLCSLSFTTLPLSCLSSILLRMSAIVSPK